MGMVINLERFVKIKNNEEFFGTSKKFYKRGDKVIQSHYNEVLLS